MVNEILGTDETLFMHTIYHEMSDMVNKNSIIYKYVGFETGKIILQESSLAFKNPLYFNDPYDCALSLLDFSKPPTNYRKNLISKYYPKLNRSDKRKKLADFNKKSNHFMNNIMMNSMKKDLELRGITCFSESFNNLLMWSHYGESHAEICIGFDLGKLYRNLKNISHPERLLIKVKYEQEIKSMDYFKYPTESVVNWLRTKSIDWKYEKEIRIILYNLKFNKNNLHVMPIKKDCINCIFLGSKTLPKNEITIRELLAKQYPEVIIKKLKLNTSKFELVSD